MLPMQAATLVTAVTRSGMKRLISSEQTTKSPTKSTKKPTMLATIGSCSGVRRTLSGDTSRGRTTFFSSRQDAFSVTSTRIIFMPPPVEPAQPPQNMSTTSIRPSARGQRSKSAVQKPVVVTTDTTWKAP